MVYTQFNGWSIVPVPSAPAFSQITFDVNDSVAQTQSPFTMQSQVQAWPGADWWQLQLALPAMKRADAQPWIAWLLALRGKQNVFQIGDPAATSPLGTALGAPVLDGAHLAMATTINTKGWTPLQAAALKAADYMQIGYRLHRVAQPLDCNTDATGKAQIDIWPSLREPAIDGAPINTSNCKGLFRLPENKRSWSLAVDKTYGFSFTAIEAR